MDSASVLLRGVRTSRLDSAYKIIQEGFLCIFTSLLFILIVYWAVGFQGNFGVMVLIYYLTTMISIALAYAIATIAPNLDAASARGSHSAMISYAFNARCTH